MNILELKTILKQSNELLFEMPNGTMVPNHFHITEMGLKTKNFIDCGNTVRTENLVTFQLWIGNDFDHSLTSEKFLTIIDASQPLYISENLEIEVEYQTETTLVLFNLLFNNQRFKLTPKSTNCLAKNSCGATLIAANLSMQDLTPNKNCCTPESGCC